VVRFIAQRYSKKGLESLFLTSSFPLHFWALLLAFRDISWLTERTNLWDAIGVVSYGLIFAFVESVMIFLVLVLIGFVIPGQWPSDRRITFLALLILLIALWGIIGQLLFLWNVSLPPQAIQFLRSSSHPLRILYAACLVVVIPTISLPIYLFVRSKRSVAFMQDLMERFSLLTMFYLVFDAVSLVIVIIRNIN
jgi:hypothetical protein